MLESEDSGFIREQFVNCVLCPDGSVIDGTMTLDRTSPGLAAAIDQRVYAFSVNTLSVVVEKHPSRRALTAAGPAVPVILTPVPAPVSLPEPTDDDHAVGGS